MTAPRLVRLSCALTAGSSLLYLYVTFLMTLSSAVDSTRITAVEAVIIATQLARLLLVLALPRLRTAKPETIWTLFSLETFFVVGLMGIYLFTADLFYPRLVVDIFSTWVAALFLVTTPYTIFRLMTSMHQGASITRTFFSSILEFGFVAFLVGIASTFRAGFTFNGFLNLFIVNLRHEVSAGKNPITITSSLIGPAVVLYIGLLIYALIPERDARVDVRMILIPALFGTIALLGWVSVATVFLPSMILSLTLPVLAVTLLLWWSTRAN